VAFATFSMAVSYIPIGIFFIIFSSNPFITAILAYFWTGDTILLLEAVAMFGAFAGIICLGLAEPNEMVKVESMSVFEQTYAYQIGVVLSVITCFTASVVQVSTRKLKSLNFGVISFFYSLTSTVCIGIVFLAFCVSKGQVPYVYESWWIYLELLTAAAINMVGQSYNTYSYQHGNPTTVSLINYMGVLYNFLVDLTIFNATFTSLQLTGVSITLSFSVVAAIYKIKLQNETKIGEEEGKDELK
jgi:drug/metabolite transporter (DMT)-like permease